jgi:hypothetical protein
MPGFTCRVEEKEGWFSLHQLEERLLPDVAAERLDQV